MRNYLSDDGDSLDGLEMVAHELIASEWEEFQLDLSELRANLVHSKREIAQALDESSKKDATIAELNEQVTTLQSQVTQLEVDFEKHKIYAERLYHRVNELVTHIEQRDYQIAQLANRRAIKVANVLGNLKRKILP